MHGRSSRRRQVAFGATGVAPAQPGLTQPAPQAATGRQGRVREMAGQDQADQFGSPTRVFLTEGLGLQDQSVAGVRAGGGSVIGWRGNLSAMVTAQSDEVVNGTQGEVETLGQGLRGKAAVMGTEHCLTDGWRNGAWHDRTLPKN
jgi:hypothetical protein